MIKRPSISSITAVSGHRPIATANALRSCSAIGVVTRVRGARGGVISWPAFLTTRAWGIGSRLAIEDQYGSFVAVCDTSTRNGGAPV